jgi:type IV pilus assembly protein PilO
MALADTLQSWQESLQDFDFNELDAENIGSWPLVVKAIIWVLVFSGCVFGGYKFIIEDLYTNLASIEAKEVKLRGEYKTKAFQAANLDAYKKQMVEMKQSFGALVGQLPSDTEVPGLLEDITNRGVDNGLQFSSIELKPERKAEFYVELPIDVVVEGSYHDIGSFVSGVAGLPRIVTLHNFVIEPVQPDSGSTATGADLVMAITAKTYRYADEEEVSLQREDRKSRKKKKKGGRK